MTAIMSAEELKVAEKLRAIEGEAIEGEPDTKEEGTRAATVPRFFFGFVLLALAWALLFLSLTRPPAPDPPALKLVHVVPTTELLDQPVTADAQVMTSRAQFSAIFGEAEVRKNVVAVYVEGSVTSSLDLLPNLDSAHASVASPPAPPAPPPPSPRPPSPRPPPSPYAPTPQWILQSRIPPRPKLPTRTNASLPADDARGSWAYEVLDPRPGTVLLSQRRPATSEQEEDREPYLNDAVILLVKTCGCHPDIFGILLSGAPANLTVGETMCPVARARYHSFVDHRVHVGGPVGPHWALLNPQPLAGSIEVAPSLHVGGCLAHAQSKVDDGTMNATDLTFFSGYAAWPIARLQQEISDGQWLVAKASSEMLLDGVRDGTLGAARLAAKLL